MLLGFCAGFLLAPAAGAQVEKDLDASRRVFTDVGPGFRGIKRDPAGRYYVLTAPAATVAVYSAAGERVGQIPALAAAPGRSTPPAAREGLLVFGEDVAVDAAGRICVADRGADAVKVFNPDGTLALLIPVPAPVAVAALPEGEFAVASVKSAHLVTVFAGPGAVSHADAVAPQGKVTGALRREPGAADAPGRVLREFGDPAELAERNDLNRFANVGRLVADSEGNLYYAFRYLPEPTVRKYDRFGYAALEISLTTLEFQASAQAARREITRQEKRGGTPLLHPIVTALGVDPVTQEIWVALGNLLLQFDRGGGRKGAYRIYTPEGARLEATTILVEPTRLLIAADPLGIYEFPRPGKSVP
jgi:hypothetical protein